MLSIEIRTPAFVVPPELEAREPAEVRGDGRDDVRLLVTSGSDGAATHAVFHDLPSFLARGDLVVVNASATIPSGLEARLTRPGGGTFDLNVSTRLEDSRSVVEPRKRDDIVSGDTAELPGGGRATFVERYRASRRLWIAAFEGTGDLVRYLYAYGKPIAYQHMRRQWPIEAYQTVYASEAGSAEMPSAGRPLTRAMIDRLRAKGIGFGSIVLHTGVSSPERDELPYEEQFTVPEETAARVRFAHASGHRVIAVGTTVVRALESAAFGRAEIVATRGWTDLILGDGLPLRVVDGMLTGLHEPKSTHLAILEALAGTDHVDAAYRAALEQRYLWHEFGDSHLLLP